MSINHSDELLILNQELQYLDGEVNGKQDVPKAVECLCKCFKYSTAI